MDIRGNHVLAELLAWGAMSDEQVEKDMKSMMAIEQACIKQESLEEQQMRPPSPFPPQPITTPLFDRPLPTEIVIQILAKLSFRSLIRCQLLNNTWRTIILSTPELWRNISFPSIKEKNGSTITSSSSIHDNVYIYYLNRYLNNARRRLHSLKLQSTAMIAAILESKQVVGALDVSESYIPQTLLARMQLGIASMHVHTLHIDHSNISVEDIIMIACNVPTLRIISAKGCCFASDFYNPDTLTPSLQQAHDLVLLTKKNGTTTTTTTQSRLSYLDISAMRRSSIHALVWILYRCPRLCDLIAYDCGIVLSTFFRACLLYCPTLSFLGYSPADQHCMWPWQQHSTIPYCDTRLVTQQETSKIKSITLSNTRIHPKLVTFILDHCMETLETLRIDQCWLMQSNVVLCLASMNPPHLRHVTISNSTSFVDAESIIALIKTCRGLESITFLNDRNAVNDKVVFALMMNSPPQLRRLDLRGCVLISNHAKSLLRNFVHNTRTLSLRL